MFLKQKKSLNFLFGFLGVLALSFLLFAAAPTAAVDYPIPLSGYAWSDNIGWISFDCANNNSCATSNYKTEINSAGYFQGFAWSDNIGWISFEANDVSGCPSGSCRAVFNSGTGGISGWARVISCKNNPDPTACGGWDGWVSLSGSDPDYGVSVNLATGKFEGYAWSDLAVGWINFETSVVFPPGSGGGRGGVYIRPIDPDASFVELRANGSIDSINISAGQEAALTWDTNVALESCSKISDPEDQDWNSLHLPSYDSYVVFPNQTITYTLTCAGEEGEVSDSVVINIVSEEEGEEGDGDGEGGDLPSVVSFSVFSNPSMRITILDEEGETCAFDDDNDTSTITVEPYNGFNENVSLSINNWRGLDNYLYTGTGRTYPNGYNFSRNPLISSDYGSGSIFDICVKPNTPKGNYLVNVKGGSLTKGDRFIDVIVNILTSDPTWKEI